MRYIQLSKIGLAAFCMLYGMAGCSNLLNEGSASVSGSVQGGSFDPRSSLFVVTSAPLTANGDASVGDSNNAAGQVLTVEIYNQAGVCINARSSANTAQADSIALTLQADAGQAVQPGQYTVAYVDPNSIVGSNIPVLDPNAADPNAAAAAPKVYAVYQQADDRCNATLVAAATSGSINLTQVDAGSHVTGSFQLDFGASNQLSGTFRADACAPLSSSYTQCN